MKPVSLSAAWTETVAFIQRECGLLIPLVLLFMAVPLALMMYVIPVELRQMTPGAPPPDISLQPSALLVMGIGALVIVVGALSCYALAMKPGISLREALVLGFRRMPHALAAGMIIGVGLGIPLVLLGAASQALASLYLTAATLFFSVKFLFLNALIVGVPAGPVEAIKLSWNLTRGNAGRILLLVVVMTIPIMLVQTVAGIMLGLIGFALGGADVARQAGDIGGSAALALGQMVMIVMTCRLYRQISPTV